MFSFICPANDAGSSIANTACSAFQNSALTPPMFFTVFLMMLLVYAGVYFLADVILEKWLSDKKRRPYIINMFVLGVIFIWALLFQGDDSAMRAGFSVAYILIASVLFVSGFVLSYLYTGQKMSDNGTKKKKD